MAEIVNLRQVRKSRQRDEKERTAEQNRLAHGLGKPEKIRAAAERDREATHLEAHRLSPKHQPK